MTTTMAPFDLLFRRDISVLLYQLITRFRVV